MGVPTLAEYERHAELFGGFDSIWQAALEDLDATRLGELTIRLRELAKRQRRVGRNGRRVRVEGFALSAAETAALLRRLGAAGVDDVDACRYAGITKTQLVAFRRGSDPHKSPEKEPYSQGIIRDSSRDTPTASDSARCHGSRVCQHCSNPLPPTLRSDARFCIGGACRKAASRARRAA
jgi:hypothetical protein